MAALKHDAQGFLLGDPVQIEQLLDSTQSMAKDVRDIRALLGGSIAASRSASRSKADRPRNDGVALPVVASSAYKASNDATIAKELIEAVSKQTKSGQASEKQPRPSREASAKPVANGSAGTASAAAVSQATKAVGDAVAKASSKAQAMESHQRAANGRFVKKGGSGYASGDGEGGPSPDGDSATSGAIDRLMQAVKSAGDAEEADPAIKAVNEIARPMARGYELIAGDPKEKKQERWYRRFWQHMRGKDEQDAKHQKLTQKGITALIEKPTGDGKGRSGFVSLLLIGLKAMLIAVFSRFLPKSLLGAAGLAGAGGALHGVGGVAGGASTNGSKGKAGAPAKGGKLAGMKGALKRIPLLGTALTLLGGAGAVWGSESSDMSRKEKDKATGSAVGGTAGTLGGMFAGAKLGAAIGALGGPIGIAIGGVVGGAAGAFFGDKAGQVIGETVGGWVTSLREADLPGKFMAGVDFMREGFATAMDALAAGWKAGIDYLKEIKDGAVSFLKDKANAANEAIKSATGIDLKAGAQTVITVATSAAAKAGKTVQDTVSAAGDMAKRAASATGQAIQQSTVGKGVSTVATAVKNEWQSGDRKKALIAEMDAQGITNKNERAMLLAQVDHESNGFRASEESFNYRSADRVAAVSRSAAKKGLPAIEAAMKQGPEAVAELMYGGRMGNKEPGDGYKYRGRGSIQITGRDNYRALGQKLGLDLENNPDLLLDPAIAAKASVQWWKDSGAGAKARSGDVRGTTQIVNGGQNGIAHRDQLYAKYSADPVANYSGAAIQTAQAAPTPAPAVKGVVTAHAPVVAAKVATSPVATSVPAAPPVPTAIASAGGGRGAVNPPMAEPGQDLSDRRLAHVATGGIGGAA